MCTRMIVLSLLFAAAAAIAATPLQAQDTLSDAAWAADRARRAAQRNARDGRLDSLSALVDTVLIRPSAIAMSMGDSIGIQSFYERFQVTGRQRDGTPVRTFVKSYALKPNAFVVIRNGYVVAIATGRAELYVRPGRPRVGDPFRADRPLAIVLVDVR